MQQKIQRAQVGQLEPLDFSQTDSLEMFLHALRRNVFHQDRIILRLARDDADVRRIALVSRARVRQLDQFSFRHSVTSGATSVLGISAGQYATISSTLGRPLPNPVTTGGPFSASGASSLVNRSTAPRSFDRTPIRITTSANCGSTSGEGSADGIPWQAFAPTNSVRMASNLS